MLSRVAGRAAFARTTSLPRASIPAVTRSYAANRPPKKPSRSNEKFSNSTPRSDSASKDQTWKRSDPIRFAAGRSSQEPTPKTDYKPEQPEIDRKAAPERNNIPNENSSPNQTPEKPSTATGPLPDLRQGIPSTFEAEFIKAKATPDTTPSHELNITEDQSQTSYGGGARDGGDLPKSAYETSLDRRRSQMMNYMFIAFFLLGGTGVVYLGRDWESEEEEKAHPDCPSGWNWSHFYGRIKARVSNQMGYYTEPTFNKLLPDMDPAPPYTLVMSLEDLLIHSEWTREHGWRTAKRPGMDYFVRYLSQYFELVIFTSQPMGIADPIIRKLDPFHIIMWPLFREATRYEKGEYIKDLSYLNRDLSKVILIDTKAEHAKMQPENSIILPPWKGQPGDRDLVGLIPFLEHIASMGVPDVRPVIKSFEGKHIPTEFARREAIAREQFNKQLAEERAKRPKRSGMGFLASALGMKPGQNLIIPPGEQSPAEAYEQGKMLSDQIRERGQKAYEAMERDIRENGAKWLKEMEEEEKKAHEEQVKSMKSGFLGYFSSKGDEKK
ncbi:NIF-domain-containing protein [Patellaria atrata CBS 101060]|uniref:Mitochondrial import inner membrane translocase subunit TIM50 n=1 Tax=Patellaria atrata CBS 101060 TaxID=1346257 RepID=A0A9P4SG87_9PEZI|nr:NIF-domain-containing protein [Patellaria atrata CBS 101060]